MEKVHSRAIRGEGAGEIGCILTASKYRRPGIRQEKSRFLIEKAAFSAIDGGGFCP